MGIKALSDYPRPQAALDDYRNWDVLDLEGYTKISEPLILPLTYCKTLRGWGTGAKWNDTFLGGTYIEQTSDNCPVFQTADENMHSIQFKDFAVGWTNYQGPANRNALGLMFHIPRPGVGSGWYHWTFDHFKIEKPYIGMGFDPAGLGSYAFWGNQADYLWMIGVQHNALRFISPTTVGQPVNLIRNLKVMNTQTPVISDGTAIEASACELSVEGFDLEGWRNRIAYHTGGPSVSYRRVHVEWHTWDHGRDWTIYAANGPLAIEDASFAGTVKVPTLLFETDHGGSIQGKRIDYPSGLTPGWSTPSGGPITLS